MNSKMKVKKTLMSPNSIIDNPEKEMQYLYQIALQENNYLLAFRILDALSKKRKTELNLHDLGQADLEQLLCQLKEQLDHLMST